MLVVIIKLLLLSLLQYSDLVLLCFFPVQLGYTLDEMKDFVEKAGLLFVNAVDADTHQEITEESERIYIIAQEKGKKNE